ncbi:MAG: glycoside hydrolase family 2 protein [Fibrobacterota bacterium]
MIKTLSLNGAWKFREAGKGPWLAATVPGTVHTDLLANKKIPDPFWADNEQRLQWIDTKDWEYTREFHVAAALLKEERVELVADGLDTLAEIRVNNVRVAATNDMFIEYRFDIKKFLKPGNNLLSIRFASPRKYITAKQKIKPMLSCSDGDTGSPHIRKAPYSFGWDWGPLFATSGIWKPLRIEAWSRNRILTAAVTQQHGKKGSVLLRIEPETARPLQTGEEFRYRLWFHGVCMAESDAPVIEVDDAKLWWPAGLGGQPLYTVEVELLEYGRVLDSWSHRVGLREIRLVRKKDTWGESFYFEVNGLAVFAKGANWIPAHSFVTETTRAQYDDLLSSAVMANMNMLRLWGGGIFEMDDFYDLCDEKGLLVWHDFMFACALYPGDREFAALVKAEAECQVRRLRHHACIALFCGNNEGEQIYLKQMKGSPARRRDYERIFHNVLPSVMATEAPQIPYWPSSPHNPSSFLTFCNNPKAGDAHFWDVWHMRKPVKEYERHFFRFVSEFGMQSYPSVAEARTFTGKALNVFSPEFENHQKNGGGNFHILEYLLKRYRFPKDYASLSYLSWLNQAHCMKTGVEHYRRCMPRTMGSLYWQLNDCWPVASWSSLEFSGRWKALHYAARRFYAPALVSAHVPGDEARAIQNVLKSTVDKVHLYTVYDGREPLSAELGWALYHVDNRVLAQGRMAVTLRYNESRLRKTLELARDIQKYGLRNLYVRTWLARKGELLSQDTVFLTAPAQMPLIKEALRPSVRRVSDTEYALTFKARNFLVQAAFDVAGAQFRATDNFFDLYPGLTRTVRVMLKKPLSRAAFEKALTVRSLVDSYESD